MTDNEAVAIDSAFLTERDSAHEIIRHGKLPTIGELYAGAPFFGNSIVRDIQAWAHDWLSNSRIREILEKDVGAGRAGEIRDAVQRFRNTCDYDAMIDAFQSLERESGARDRVDVYLACSGDVDARHRVARTISDRGSVWRARAMDLLLRTATARGLQMMEFESMPEYCQHGLTELRHTSGLLARFDAATAALEQAEATEADAAKDELMAAVCGAAIDDEVEDAWAPGLIVVPALPEGTTSWRKELYKGWRDHAGNRMPLVARGDVAAQRRALVQQWPHAGEIIDVILSDLAARDDVRFRPTLLVGEPGSGKSSLARAIFDVVGLPCELQSFAGLHDAALMGTSAQWSSARESAPLQLIKRTGKASVGIIWDELEKATTDRRNGSPTEALLPMLELDQAKRYRDLALEVEVDLSAVSHFATANSLEGVPAPVRDRMRVLTMPTPGWQHLGTLTRQIVDRLAKERGIDPRWFQPLAEDELDLVKSAWPGGSIRQLTRIVTTILDGREQIMGRA